jgi:hypothetical protein
MALTCSELQKVVAKMDRIWLDNQTKMDYVPNIGVLEALRKEQTARMAEIENPEKDKTLRVWWLSQCGLVAEDCTDDANDCDFTGDEVSSTCVDYALDICKSTKFSIEDNVFRNNEASAQEALAIQFLAAMKVLDEELALTAVAKLNAFAGVNQYEGIGDVDGVTTYIAANYWGADMYGYFGMVKTINKFSNPFMIHGSNLYQTNWNATYNAANANQKDGALKLNSIRSYWDLFNIDTVNNPNLVSYMVDKGAVAFASKARYPLNNPKVYQFGQRWSIESQALPGVFYDVYYKERCVANDKIYHDYKLKARAGIFNNPVGCTAEKTGVIKFVCGTNAGS